MRYPLVAALAVSLVGCGLIDQINGPGGLTIQRFVASPDAVSAGASVTLTWDVAGAETVQIDNGVGTVPAKGTKTVVAYRTATYTLSAKAGSTAATASVQVSVKGASVSDPFTFPLGPSPDPSPTPKPSPSPDASPSPSPSPSPSSGADSACGESIDSADACEIEVSHPTALPQGQCVELTRLHSSKGCPVSEGVEFEVKFELTSDVAKKLHWKRGDKTKDVVDPKTGLVNADGVTKVSVSDTVVGDAMGIDVVDDEGVVYLHFSLKHR
jgi:hypothetical protein